MFVMFIQKLSERVQREQDDAPVDAPARVSERRVSDTEMYETLGISPQPYPHLAKGGGASNGN